MALVLNEEQVMLKDAARGFLGERAPVSHLRALRDGGDETGFSRELWAEMCEMGWSAILVGEEHGGLDYGYVGIGIVLEECGRTLSPSPLLGTALAGVTALNLAGTPAQRAKYLPAVAGGDHLLALACDEGPRHEPEQSDTEAEVNEGGFRLTGRKTAVLDGQAADTLIVSAWTGDGLSLFLVPAGCRGVKVERYPVLDIGSAATVTLDRVELPPDALLGELHGGHGLLENILDAARIGAAAEMLGIAREVFARTVEYLKVRKQFGVPIGSFQALQHRAARLFGEIELCRSLVLKSLQTLDEGGPADPELASMTKAKVAQTAREAALEGIQMHGGIGMTDDFDIGFFLKRCQIMDTLYGNRYYHLDRYARCRGY